MSFNKNRHIWTLTQLLGFSGTSLGGLRIQPPKLDRLRSL